MKKCIMKQKKSKDGEYILKVVVDEEYLKSGYIKYPVTIDPTVWWVNDRLESACVSNLQYSLGTNRKKYYFNPDS